MPSDPRLPTPTGLAWAVMAIGFRELLRSFEVQIMLAEHGEVQYGLCHDNNKEEVPIAGPPPITYMIYPVLDHLLDQTPTSINIYANQISLHNHHSSWVQTSLT